MQPRTIDDGRSNACRGRKRPARCRTNWLAMLLGTFRTCSRFRSAAHAVAAQLCGPLPPFLTLSDADSGSSVLTGSTHLPASAGMRRATSSVLAVGHHRWPPMACTRTRFGSRGWALCPLAGPPRCASVTPASVPCRAALPCAWLFIRKPFCSTPARSFRFTARDVDLAGLAALGADTANDRAWWRAPRTAAFLHRSATVSRRALRCTATPRGCAGRRGLARAYKATYSTTANLQVLQAH